MAEGTAAPATIVKNQGYELFEELKQELKEFFEPPIVPKRLVLMVGGADFFHKGKRQDPYELIALVKYLKSINAHNPTDENEVTQVLTFDSAYTYNSFENDKYQLNLSIYQERKRDKLTKLNQEDDMDNNSSEYLMGNNIGNIFFTYYPFNLSTKYKSFAEHLAYYPYLNGKTPVKTMADQCVPKEGSLMKVIQEICTEIPFQEYYLYNCAWIGGTQFYTNTNGKLRVSTAKQNRYYELMCELLYIFQNLGKPAYLLTAKDMSVFQHPRKIVGAPYNSLNITPLNETTLFQKEEWRLAKGGTRKVRKTRKGKHSRKH